MTMKWPQLVADDSEERISELEETDAQLLEVLEQMQTAKGCLWCLPLGIFGTASWHLHTGYLRHRQSQSRLDRRESDCRPPLSVRRAALCYNPPVAAVRRVRAVNTVTGRFMRRRNEN